MTRRSVSFLPPGRIFEYRVTYGKMEEVEQEQVLQGNYSTLSLLRHDASSTLDPRSEEHPLLVAHNIIEATFRRIFNTRDLALQRSCGSVRTVLFSPPIHIRLMVLSL
jgi:hypothetical protein